MLKGAGYTAEEVDSPRSLLEAARSGQFDLILADLNYTRDTTSGREGLDLLAALEAQGHHTPVIVMTAWSSVDLAVEAMRRGACDFIQKPWDNARALESIEKQVRAARRDASDLDIAAVVQQRLLPNSARPLATIDYAGRCLAARGIGGDYYDFLPVEPHQMGFILGDVSGKGVPAALLMANLQACFHSRSAEELSRPAQLLSSINRHFYASTDYDRFATLFFGVYDDASRRLRYVNCGHCPPLLLRASGGLEALEPTATMIGAFAEWDCTEVEITMGPRDTLLIYSDGVVETVNDRGDLFGERRVIDLLSLQLPASDLVDRIVMAVSDFGNGSRVDDLTVVALRGI
jgi:sigma-B regulation protein RsbU (phosphoserine phosphatase)